MASSYPGSLDAWGEVADGVDDVSASHMNDVRDAIEKIEAKLGVTTDYCTTKGIDDADGDTRVTVEESADEDVIRFFIGGTEQAYVNDGAILPKTNNDVDLGSDALEFKDIWIDGTAYLDAISGCASAAITTLTATTINAFSLGGKLTGGANEIEGSNFDINGGNIDGTAIGSASASTGAFTTLSSSSAATLASIDVNGGEIVLDADGDTSLTADTDDRLDLRIAGADQLHFQDGKIWPTADDDIDLGDSTHQFKDLYVDGKAYIDALDATEIAGHLTVSADSTYDVGADATRFRYGYFDRVYGTYYDRGDPAAWDFTQANFSTSWSDLDLSSIVPAGATTVAIGVFCYAAAGGWVQFRKNGNSNDYNISSARFSAGYHDAVLTVSCDTSRIIEGKCSTGLDIDVIVKGWWF